MAKWFGTLALVGLGAACGGDASPGDDADRSELDVKVRTESDAEWEQYLADATFARDYTATCAPRAVDDRRPRVLVSGFGRFGSNSTNATGLMVSRLTGVEYPVTTRPAAGVDPPAPQTRVRQTTLRLADLGEVEVCALVLPVTWDVAAVVLAREADAFGPDFVLMNGISGAAEDLWIELGSVNRASASTDGSDVLRPIAEDTPLVPGGPDELPLLLSWSVVRDAARAAIEVQGGADHGGTRYRQLVQGARFAGYPRASNTYLCNNVSYTLGYLLDRPRTSTTLLEPSKPRPGGPTGVDVGIAADLAAVPRVFLHWPSRLDGEHIDASAAVMEAVIGAQLAALVDGPAPTRGDKTMAQDN